MERLQKLETEIEEEMMEWLDRHRLTRHAETVMTIAGVDAAPGDLQYLTDEDIAGIGSEMTRIEKMRLQAALQTLRGMPSIIACVGLFADRTPVVRCPDGQAE